MIIGEFFFNFMSPKAYECNLRGKLRVSEATERGEGLGGGGRILHFEPEKTVSDAYILSKDYKNMISSK